jgi:hypothetical protein
MKFDLIKSMEILDRTPGVLNHLLNGLSREWVLQNEGEGTWSPFDVVGHLIHGEKTDWIPRMQIILEHGPEKPFEPYDRFAQEKINKGKSMEDLLLEFTRLRQRNLRILTNASLDKSALERKGTHPELGVVTLRELLATWVAHDLGHIVQIARVMAKQHEQEVGPWKKYLTVVNN